MGKWRDELFRSGWLGSWSIFTGLVIAFTLFWTTPSRAQELEDKSIPPSLRPWVPWILSELGEETCTPLGSTRACVWPGTLELELSSAGASFEQEVNLGAKAFHVLPGQSGAWPEDLLVDDKARPVLSRDGHPVVELERGTHRLQGHFSWSSVPETLHVGAHTAFLSLKIDGKSVPLVKREGGSIWLKGLSWKSEAGDEPEELEMSVFRRILDGVPVEVETRLVFQVSGKARELSFPNPLVAGTVALFVEGDLAVALEPNGALRVQLLPGRHEVRLSARAVGMPEEFMGRKRVAPWPAQEIWSWHPQTDLRTVELSGPPGIDPSRTELPSDWHTDGAYAIGPDDVLKLKTTRRAQEQIPSNHIALRREFWLDEESGEFTVRDHLSGEIHQNWRLELKSGHLGQATLGGVSQVITLGQDGKSRGLEVRDAQLDLTAISRVKRNSSIAAVGWDDDVDSLSAEVHLPPGWDLFFATGVDEISGSWLSRWDLFSVFYVLLMTLAVARLRGAVAGAIAAGALILCHEESGAPQYIWIPLVALVALITLLNEGRFQRILRGAFHSTSLILLIMLVSFSVDQVRMALYPHLGAYPFPDNDYRAFTMEEKPASPPVPDEPTAVSESLELGRDGAGAQQSAPLPNKGSADKKLLSDSSRRLAFGSSQPKTDTQKESLPDAIVQTGPGVPETSGSNWSLNWSGPVVRSHQMRLYLISPVLMRVLTVLRLVLLFALAFLLFRHVYPQGSDLKGKLRQLSKAPGVTKAAILLLFLSIGLPRPAFAEEPSDARLLQLKERLQKAPSCFPDCISVSSLHVELQEDLILRARVHAGARAAYRLPGPASALAGVELQVDGRPTTVVRLEDDGAYYLRLEEGVHLVEMRASLLGDRATLDVGTTPERVSLQSQGWIVTGINDEGRVEGGTLTFQRSVLRGPEPQHLDMEQADAQRSRSQVAVSPFFIVTRSIDLGITGKVTTRIERKSDSAAPESLRLKLLAGEHLTSAGIEVKEGFATVPFPRETTAQELVSTLDLVADQSPVLLALTSPKGSSSTEVWKLRCSVVWHCSLEGLRATAHVENGISAWTFHPWPGDSLKVSAIQPPSASGESLTIQGANLTLTPRIRMTHGKLELSLQSSRATVHTVTIPPLAKLEGVKVDGITQAVRAIAGKVQISLTPGLRRIEVNWQDPEGLTALFRGPAVSAGAAGVNFRVAIDLPSERWLLLAQGPSQGPAILLWGYLVLIVVASLLLPRLPYSPLSSVQWLLLGLGLTQIPAVGAVFVGGWFFFVGSRNAWPPMGRKKKNFLQLLLWAYTVAFLLSLTGAVYEGLVSSPDMEVQGAGSHSSHLVWFNDRSAGEFAMPRVLSLSIWFWRIFMLAWALWLSKSMLNWLRWAWLEMSTGGVWVSKAPATPKPPPGPQPVPKVVGSDAPLEVQEGDDSATD